MTRTIQSLGAHAARARQNYGETSDEFGALAAELVRALTGPRKIIDVEPGTLTCYAGVGIAVNCDYNPDMKSRQPFVTINTEELDVRHRYGANANLVQERDSLSTVGGGPTDRIQALNAEIDRQAGMPAIAVHLNDAVLYDDTGHGNMASVVGTPTVYVVRPFTFDVDVAAFTREEDAEAFNATFEESERGPVEVVTICDSALAREMIADRTEDDD